MQRRSHPACRLPPQRTDASLVISFSDEETSDDCGHPNQAKTSEIKGLASRLIGNRKPPFPAQSNLKSNNNAKHKAKSFPKKTSLSRTFVLSNSKVSRTNSAPGQGTQNKHRSVNKKCSGLEHDFNQPMNLSCSELQDLRHQIALRENELKLKARKQSKTVSSSVGMVKLSGTNCSDSDTREIEETVTDSMILSADAMGNSIKKILDIDSLDTLNKNREIVSVPFIPNSDSNKNPRTNSSDIEELETQGHEKKRKKVNDSFENLGAGDNQEIPTSKSVITAVIPIIANSDQGNNIVCDSFCNKEPPFGQVEVNTRKWKEISEKPVLIPPGNLPRADITVKGCQSEKYSDIQSVQITNPIPCPVSLNHASKKCGNPIKEIVQDTTESRNHSNFIQQNPPALIKKTIHGKDTFGLNALDFQLSTTPTCNILNEENNSGHSDGDVQSLIEMEEINDKELEEALDIRRKCEIEEINALRFYRKSQRALIDANCRCSHLYRKRDVHSAHLRSLMMGGDSGLLHSLRQCPPIVNTGLKLGPEDNIRTVPVTSHLFQKELNIYNPPDYVSYVPLVETAATIVNTNKIDANSLGLDPHATVSESPFEQIPTCNSFPCNVQNISADGDKEGIPFALTHTSNSVDLQKNGEKDVGNNRSVHIWFEKGSLDDNLAENWNQDVSLRSELLPLPTKQSLNCNNHACSEDRGQKSCEINIESGKLQQRVNGALAIDLYDRGRFDHSVESEPYHGIIALSTPKLIFRSALYHMKVKSSICLYGKSQENQGTSEKNSHQANHLKSAGKDAYINDNSRKLVSKESKPKIHPFWPLCMFELRGKCNDDKCPWQHARDYYKSTEPANLSHLVGNFQPKYFRASRTLSNPQQHSFMLDGSVMNESDCGDDDIQASLNRHSMYFLSRKDGLDQYRQGLVGNEHILEMAFFALYHDPNKSYSINKVLNILSRALEANPTSVILWVVYLRIFYRGKKSVVRDDMFLHAVKHNEGSYELWLMYIDSRELLQDRISAYNSALSSLSLHAPPPSSDPSHLSSCILDIFLQMLDFYRMSAHTHLPIKTLHTTFLSPLLSSLLSRLILSDRCILWASSVYFFLYHNLPPEILTLFDRPKSLAPFHWPPPPPTISTDEKQHALSLMEFAVDSLKDAHASDASTLRPLHMFALNHVLFSAALDLPSASTLLDKYVETYPSSLELAILQARCQKPSQNDAPFSGFKNILKKWQRHGAVHSVVNQYVEHVLRNGPPDLARDILLHWFTSHCTDDRPTTKCEPADAVFGFLNLSLYKLLQGDKRGAEGAAKQALEKSRDVGGDTYFHALREHAVLSFSGFGSGPGALINCDIPSPGPVLLSRRFMEGVKKPRIRGIVERMLGTTSGSFSEANLVLETWFGETLLPGLERVEVVVDFVESVVEMFPSNYELGIAVCRMMSREVAGVNGRRGRLFWAVSVLVDSLYKCFPKAPESAWIEAARFLGVVAAEGGHSVFCEGFRERAVCEYPFSVQLLDSCLALGKAAAEEEGTGRVLLEG